MPLFGKLDNLQNLGQLHELENMQKLDQLQHLDKLENLRLLENLNQLQHLSKLQQLQALAPLNNLQQLQQMQQLRTLQHLDKLANMQSLTQLQNLNMLKSLQHMEKLNELERLQQLQVLQRLGKLEHLSQMPQLQELKNLNHLAYLDQLYQTRNLANLGSLDRLYELAPLNRLGAIQRVWSFNYASLLYLASVIVPGLVFQETISIFLKEHLSTRRALVLMAVYNVLTLFICLNFVYHRLTLPLLAVNPVYYYFAWFCVLLLIPALAGWVVAFFLNRSALGAHLKRVMVHTPASTVKNAWNRFLTEAESYQVVITLNNDIKIKGTFSKGMSVPQTAHPNDLYVSETSFYDPKLAAWTELDQPTGIWVKGTEVKMVEVAPQP